MTTETLKQDPFAPPASELPQNEFAYRSISKAAVASVVLAILGALTSFLAPMFVVLAMLAAVFGIIATISIRRYPEELIGQKAAYFGLVVGAFCFIGGSAYHTYVYATEVPEGYQRISYGQLRDNTRTGAPFSEKAEDFDGKKVFLKGYVRPGDRKRKLKEFVLVGDFGDCCFGGNPDPTEVVAIRIVCDESVDYGLSLRRIGGTFRLNKRPRASADKDIPHIFYEIEADHVR